jgi:hypothetical protein
VASRKIKKSFVCRSWKQEQIIKKVGTTGSQQQKKIIKGAGAAAAVESTEQSTWPEQIIIKIVVIRP